MMTFIRILTILAVLTTLTVAACNSSDATTTPTSPTTGTTTTTGTNTSAVAGTIITNIRATGTGGGAPFDGTVNQSGDLAALVETAWGDGRLDLHRGHAPIQNILEAFLGISHAQMHVYMQEQGLNLAGVARVLGFSPENMVESLKYSFIPFIQQGVTNGVIPQSDVEVWTARVREQFNNRVNWNGQ